MVSVISSANLSLTKTKHVCLSASSSFAMKLKNFFSPLSSAQYEILCNGYWCIIRCKNNLRSNDGEVIEPSTREYTGCNYRVKDIVTIRRMALTLGVVFVFGSCIATPSMLIVSSTFGVFVPSLFFSCWLNFNLQIASLTTSMPLGWSTSVLPKY